MLVDIAIYDDDMQKHALEDVFIDNQEITEVPSELYTDIGKVNFILLNDNIDAFVKVHFDDRSLTNLLAVRPTDISDKLDRMLAWTYLENAVNDSEVSSLDLFNWLVLGLSLERDDLFVMRAMKKIPLLLKELPTS